jgi:hypothetical protein
VIKEFATKQDNQISHTLMSEIQKVDFEINEKLKMINEASQKLDERVLSSEVTIKVILSSIYF